MAADSRRTPAVTLGPAEAVLRASRASRATRGWQLMQTKFELGPIPMPSPGPRRPQSQKAKPSLPGPPSRRPAVLTDEGDPCGRATNPRAGRGRDGTHTARYRYPVRESQRLPALVLGGGDGEASFSGLSSPAILNWAKPCKTTRRNRAGPAAGAADAGIIKFPSCRPATVSYRLDSGGCRRVPSLDGP